MNKISLKKITKILFGTITVLVFFMLISLFYLLSKHESDGSLINYAGRQRMLSQHITKICLQVSQTKTSNAEHLKNLKISLNQFSKTHNELLLNNGSFDEKKNSKEINKLLKKLCSPYDTLFLNATKIANNEHYSNLQISAILDSETKFLPLMNKIVYQYEKENNNKIKVIKITTFLSGFIIIFILFLQIRFIISPIINQNLKVNLELISSNEETKLQNDILTETEKIVLENYRDLTILNDKNEKQKIELQKAHNNIMGSINYAKKIQEALLTSNVLISSYFSGGHFVLFMPKETISGDFYYVNKFTNHLVFAVADCTGHGVPGAFITILGITYLHEIVRETEINSPGVALNILREKIKGIFKTFGSNNNNGLDIALSIINIKTHELEFAGAYNPLWIIRNNELIEIKANRNPIGFYPKEKPFDSNIIQLEDSDKIYAFSDGYKDQFNNKDRKFGNKKFRELIIESSNSPMEEQNKILIERLDRWQGSIPQIDDITIVGLEYKIEHRQLTGIRN